MITNPQAGMRVKCVAPHSDLPHFRDRIGTISFCSYDGNYDFYVLFDGVDNVPMRAEEMEYLSHEEEVKHIALENARQQELLRQEQERLRQMEDQCRRKQHADKYL